MDYPKVGRDITIKSFKTDILTQIAEKYHKTQAKTSLGASKEVLVPTKATLFGLDIRFRDVDKKIAEGRDLDKRLSLNVTKNDGRNRKFF